MNFFREITRKPWLAAEGAETELSESGFALPKPTLGLRIIMLVATVLFSLFIVTYSDRMLVADWKAMPEPWLLWLNTGLLVLASVALHWAIGAAAGDVPDGLRTRLLVAAAISVAFLVGQLLVWQDLVSQGYFAASNPANAYFYTLTALHGLHLLGGLAAVGRALAKTYSGTKPADLRQTVELCAVYWDFLFVVWLVLFGLLLFT